MTMVKLSHTYYVHADADIDAAEAAEHYASILSHGIRGKKSIPDRKNMCTVSDSGKLAADISENKRCSLCTEQDVLTSEIPLKADGKFLSAGDYWKKRHQGISEGRKGLYGKQRRKQKAQDRSFRSFLKNYV